MALGVAGILLAAGSGSRFDPSGARYKLLQALPGGEPVVVASARALLAALPRVVAVVRAQDSATAGLLRELGCEVVVCERAGEGMAASLVCGVRYAQDADGWLIALADMPYVLPATMAALAHAVAPVAGQGGLPQRDGALAGAGAGGADCGGNCGANPGAAHGEHSGEDSGEERGGAGDGDRGGAGPAGGAAIAAIAAPVHGGRRGNPVAFGRAHLQALLALEGDQGARSILKNNPVNELAVDDPGILQDIDTPSDIT
ncbi:nucleotidyltransferase family protein [Massilia sp. SR12]